MTDTPDDQYDREQHAYILDPEHGPVMVVKDSPAFKLLEAKLNAERRKQIEEIDRALFASGGDHPPLPPVAAWRRALRRARYYVAGVWGAVRELGNALRGKPHECESDW